MSPPDRGFLGHFPKRRPYQIFILYNISDGFSAGSPKKPGLSKFAKNVVGN
jgi:hypothetical protein